MIKELKEKYVGKKTNDVIDEITAECKSHKCTVEIMDPVFNLKNIDVDMSRVNIYQDADGVIKNLKLG